MKRADQRNLGLGVLGLLACTLLNVWSFRFGILVGLVGLNLTKHVGVAVLCQAVATTRSRSLSSRHRTFFQAGHKTLVGPHSLARDAR